MSPRSRTKIRHLENDGTEEADAEIRILQRGTRDLFIDLFEMTEDGCGGAPRPRDTRSKTRRKRPAQRRRGKTLQSPKGTCYLLGHVTQAVRRREAALESSVLEVAGGCAGGF